VKPFYNLGYSELISSAFRFELKQRKLLLLVGLPVLFALLMFFFMLYNWQSVILLAMFVVCFLSMMHMRLFTWLGAFDMNTILTVYATVHFGLPAGLFIGNASVLGNLFVGEVDLTPYDIFASMVVACVGLFFTPQTWVIGAVVGAIVYAAMGFIYLTLTGMMEWTNIVWLTSNFAWVLFVMLKLYPLIFG
jgi:hypothetical protein